jgi:hypothetical protein
MVSIASAGAPAFRTTHTDVGQHRDARGVQRIANVEAVIVLALLLAACVLHLA